jgi:hypothetical protein
MAETPAVRTQAAPAEPSAAGAAESPQGRPRVAYQPIALVDLLDRLLAGGVVITGEIRLSIADVDMVSISLQALISSVSTAFGPATGGRGEAGD